MCQPASCWGSPWGLAGWILLTLRRNLGKNYFELFDPV